MKSTWNINCFLINLFTTFLDLRNILDNMVIHGGSNGKESALNSGDQSREDPLEKEIATHSSILAWKIPWTEEPGGLQSIGLQRVGHDWATAPNQREFLFTVSFSTYCLCAKTFLCVSVCLNNFFLIKKIPMKWLIFLA